VESVFFAKSYKSFLHEAIASRPSGGRGVRKRLAAHIGCQVGYITQVLSGGAHFSPEQGEAAARFFQLSAKETEYFLLLISHNRAGTSSLRHFYEGMLGRRRQEAKLLKSRLAIEGPETKRYHQVYYSSWQYAAVHMALHCEELRTAEKISKRLKIAPKRTQAILNFLEENGLARKDGERYQVTDDSLHLERDSPMIAKHHGNWRLRAIQAIEEGGAKDLHYSGVVSCSRRDLALVQEKLAKCLEECIAIVRTSPPEELGVLNMDLFQLVAAE
jgi:uncharacterized protein (TIGR02147 family)